MGIGNRLIALNEQTGRLVWQQQIPADYVFSSFQLVNGIVYASSSQQVEKDPKQYEQSKKISAFDAKTGTIVWTSPPGYTMLDGTSIADGLLVAQGQQNGVLTLNAFRVKDGTLAWQMNDPCSPNKCFDSTVYLVHGTGYLFEMESAKTDIPVKIKSFDWQSGKLLAQKPTIWGSTFIGMSNGIVYQQETIVNGSRKNQKFTDVVVAIRLSDGLVLWQYSLKDAGNGMDAPGILAP
jgi:outer membrane protein assembly factor BamB